MHLGSWATKTRKNISEISDREFFCWREHPKLHTWMFQRFESRTGEDDPWRFNGVPLALTLEDIDWLERDVLAERLPAKHEFRYSSPPDTLRRMDLKFIEKARTLLAEGWSIHYWSWW